MCFKHMTFMFKQYKFMKNNFTQSQFAKSWPKKIVILTMNN